MHRSRLAAIVVDCRSDDLDRDAEFWSAALGRAARPRKAGEDPRYLSLDTAPDELQLLLQKVEHPSRVHIDIETDDVDAEVARLERLGARRIEAIKGWWVMEAPSGHRFCVVPQQSAELASGANEWP